MIRTLVAMLLGGIVMTGSALAQPPLPVIDTSTPDSAVRSMWAMLDWETAARNKFKCIEDVAEGRKVASSYLGAVRKLLAGNSLELAEQEYRCQYKAIDQKFSRVISELRMETDTRAIIEGRMKNVTPIPAGFVLSEDQRREREKGERVRYVLTNTGSGWRIEQIFAWTIDYSNTAVVIDDDPNNDDDQNTWVEIQPEADFVEHQIAPWDLTSVDIR